VLGQPWTVPRTRSPFPLTWEEETAAPWPWRVRRALDEVYQALSPGSETTGERARRWVATCEALPCTTPDEALLFVRASRQSTHLSSLEILARWRRIAADGSCLEAAALVGNAIGDLHRLWDDERGRLACRAMAAEILRDSPHKQARDAAAYGLRNLACEPLSWPQGKRLPVPAGALRAAIDRALDPATGDGWTRLYVYAFSVCEALPDPPFVPDRWTDPSSPRVAELLDEFAAWAGTWSFEGHELLQEQAMLAELAALDSR
jgi:hypothetical protein